MQKNSSWYVSILLAFALGFSLPQAFPQLHLHTEDEQSPGAHMDHHGVADHAGMHHDAIEVDPTLPIPSIAIEVVPDAKAGYNLTISTENYLWAPDKASSAPSTPNEGHAHLYVNDVKVARVYSPYFHIPPEYFRIGENIVRVTLNTNQHADRVSNGLPIQAEHLLILSQ